MCTGTALISLVNTSCSIGTYCIVATRRWWWPQCGLTPWLCNTHPLGCKTMRTWCCLDHCCGLVGNPKPYTTVWFVPIDLGIWVKFSEPKIGSICLVIGTWHQAALVCEPVVSLFSPHWGTGRRSRMRIFIAADDGKNNVNLGNVKRSNPPQKRRQWGDQTSTTPAISTNWSRKQNWSDASTLSEHLRDPKNPCPTNISP